MSGKHGTLVRTAYVALSLVWWLLSGFGRWGAGSALVLCYHSILSHQRERLRKQMGQIASRAISVHELSGAPRRRRNLPRVCVTFDDAFANLLDNALPVTNALMIPTAVFVVTGNMGHTPGWAMRADHPDARERTMTPDEVRSAAQSPYVSFGSHTVSHPVLPEIPLDEARSELTCSKRVLEDLLDCPIVDLAVPYGNHSDELIRSALAVGYERIYIGRACCHPDTLPAGCVGRFAMSPDAWPVEYRLTVAGAYAWLRPWRAFVGRIREAFSARRVSRFLLARICR